MNITKPQVEQILKTLPLGYYIKKKVDVELSDERGSYYDMMNEKIFISYPMIENVCKSLPADKTLENDVRCLLYHEASHAFITPKKLNVTDIMNIFEDERIETIFKNYYLGVNFKEFVKRVNNFTGSKPSSGKELFYQIVRYRVGPQEFIDRVSDIITRHKELNVNSTRMKCYSYQSDVERLYTDITDYFNQSSQSNSSQTNDSTQNASQMAQQSCSSENLSSEDCSSNEDETGFGKDEVEALLEQSISLFDDDDMSQEIEKILLSVKKSSKMNGSAINAYSGIFDPRSVVRKDYKFFVQQNRAGHVKAFSKIHLNLFIDCSGSFEYNDLTVNKFLKALHKFERSNNDFTFDLISCGVGQRIRDKNDRIQLKSNGGTALKSTIFSQFKSLQRPNSQTINIVLYDGDASDKYDPDGSNFSAFNDKSCILIVDPENETYVNKHCTSAKVIITQDYTNELRRRILDALQILAR